MEFRSVSGLDEVCEVQFGDSRVTLCVDMPSRELDLGRHWSRGSCGVKLRTGNKSWKGSTLRKPVGDPFRTVHRYGGGLDPLLGFPRPRVHWVRWGVGHLDDVMYRDQTRTLLTFSDPLLIKPFWVSYTPNLRALQCKCRLYTQIYKPKISYINGFTNYTSTRVLDFTSVQFYPPERWRDTSS